MRKAKIKLVKLFEIQHNNESGIFAIYIKILGVSP